MDLQSRLTPAQSHLTGTAEIDRAYADPQLRHVSDQHEYNTSNQSLDIVETIGLPSSTQRRKRLACKGCRQAKIKCDASDRRDGPCTRCRRMKVECRIDATYRRVTKRQTNGPRLSNDDAQHEEDLSSTLDLSYPDGSTIRRHDAAVDSGEYQLPLQTYESNEAGHRMQRPVINGNPGVAALTSPPASLTSNFTDAANLQTVASSQYTCTAPRTIEHLTVNEAQIAELFKLYYENYHPHLSILDALISPDMCYSCSRLLFWTIISVASRRYKADPILLSSLSGPVMKLLWQTISTPPHSEQLVKAMILICVWPFPTSSMSTDLSFILVHVAKAVTMQLGLHRPDNVQDFLREQKRLNVQQVQESVRVWSGCYVAAQGITSSIGQQSMFANDWVIDRACTDNTIYSLPESFRHQLRIQQFSCHVSRVMSENRLTPTGLPDDGQISSLLGLLEEDFDDLSQQLSGKLTELNELLLLGTSLQLRTFYFFERPENRRRGLLKSYYTALEVISKTDEATNKSGYIRYCPAHSGRMILLAAVVLLKILFSNLSQLLEVEGGKQAFNTAVTLLRTASIENNDLDGRSSKILAQLWTAYSSSTSAAAKSQEPSLHLRTRSNASVMHEALWNWRDRFGKQATLGQPNPSGEGSHDDNSARDYEMDYNYAPNANFDDMGSIWNIDLQSLLAFDLPGLSG